MNARDIAVAAIALTLGCLGPTAALVAGVQGSCGAASIVVGALIAATLLGSAGVVLAATMRTRCRGRNANCCEIGRRS